MWGSTRRKLWMLCSSQNNILWLTDWGGCPALGGNEWEEKHSYDRKGLLASWSFLVSLICQALPLVFICTAPLKSLLSHWFIPAGDCPIISSRHKMEAESPATTTVVICDARLICCCSADKPTHLQCCLLQTVLPVSKKSDHLIYSLKVAIDEPF